MGPVVLSKQILSPLKVTPTMGTQHRGLRDSTLGSTEHLLHSTSPNTHTIQPRDPALTTLLRDGLSQDSLLRQED